jgi:hypothetical protein
MQRAAAFFVCGQCDAAYDSESSLNAHKSRSHRGSRSDQQPRPQDGTPGQASKTQSKQQASPNDEGDATDSFR